MGSREGGKMFTLQTIPKSARNVMSWQVLTVRSAASSFGPSLLLFFLLLLTISPTVSIADQPAAEVAQEHAEEQSELAKKEKLLDRHKSRVDSQAQRAAQWVDSFFYDSNYEAEVATSQFRVRPELHYRQEQDVKARLKFSLKVRLPGIERKVSIVAGNSGEDSTFGDAVDDTTENSVVGLQFFGKSRKSWHTSLSAGIKFNDFAFFIGPRVSYFKSLGDKSSYQFTQILRWQTNNFWQSISRVDFNHAFNDGYFFRQTVDGRWRGEKSDEEGYRTRISSILTQRLKNSAGLQYDFTTIFHTRPDTHVARYTLSLRYRKRTWREWFYYEIVPEISFEDEFDYKANPGIRLRVEVFFGADKDTQFWRREHEDTDDFRW